MVNGLRGKIDDKYLEKLHYYLLFKDYDRVAEYLYPIGYMFAGRMRISYYHNDDVIQRFVMKYEYISKMYKPKIVDYREWLYKYLYKIFKNEYYNCGYKKGLYRIIKELNER